MSPFSKQHPETDTGGKHPLAAKAILQQSILLKFGMSKHINIFA